MKVSRTAAVLCAVAVASVSASADVKTEAVTTETEAGNKHDNNRALRGGADHGKTAKKKPQETKKRALKAKDEASSDEGTGGENRAFTTGPASTSYNNQAVASTYQQGSNNAYANNKYGYLDRYAGYLTQEQLEKLRNPGSASASSDDPVEAETNVGGTEAAVPTTVASPARPVTTASSSYTQTAATAPASNTAYVSAPELNRMSDADSNADALNRNHEAEAPIANYDATTGYGVVGSSSNANTNSNAGQQPVPSVQTTAWKPITQDTWVEHYVPGVPQRPAWDTGDSASTWANKPSNAGGTSSASANAHGSYSPFPNRNPSTNEAASNRIPVEDAPCDGTNTSKSPSRGIQSIFENPWGPGGWGSCATTQAGCRPGECCLYHPTFGGGACVPFSEICEVGETPGTGDCPYPWMTSDKCLCGGGSDDPL